MVTFSRTKRNGQLSGRQSSREASWRGEGERRAPLARGTTQNGNLRGSRKDRGRLARRPREERRVPRTRRPRRSVEERGREAEEERTVVSGVS